MELDWPLIDRTIMGEAYVGSHIGRHLQMLCDQIGVRWAGTEHEHAAAAYSLSQFESCSLQQARIDPFDLQTWECLGESLSVVGDDAGQLDARACLYCPPIERQARLVDVGYAMPHEVNSITEPLDGCIALVDPSYEPFSEPRLLVERLHDLVQRGVHAVVTTSPHSGRRLSHVNVADWRDDPTRVPLPVVQTSREDAARLRAQAAAGAEVCLRVQSEFRSAQSWNAVADLVGSAHPEECLVLGAHHDTTPDSYGANDNGAGVAVLLETARLLSALSRETGTRPGRTIRFVSFGAEEQGLQGSTAFVKRYVDETPVPRFMLALDELCTGTMKGVVLQFPQFRPMIQRLLDDMNEGLQCHVLSQMDASGDMYPFARRGVPASFLWRWRFIGRHPDTDFGHSSADTLEKVRIRELKEYAGLLARFLLRLSHVAPADWPSDELSETEIAQRIELERGTVFRTR